MRKFIAAALLMAANAAMAQPADYSWTSQSKNSSESMPVGGGSIALNVWAENNDLLFYISRSGSFDENNTILKQGRVRIKGICEGNNNFKQTLHLNDGNMTVATGGKNINIWVDVFKPVIHVNIDSKQSTDVEVVYENWRFQDHLVTGGELAQTSFKHTKLKDVYTYKDSIKASGEEVTFFHQNKHPEKDAFHRTVEQQGLKSVESQMYNPISDYIFGGRMIVEGMAFTGMHTGKYLNTEYMGYAFKSKSPKKQHSITIALADCNGSLSDWNVILGNTEKHVNEKRDLSESRKWWNEFWKRSWIEISGEEKGKEVARNYALFRYMLACNAYGQWPTKFNGGLVTFDPVKVQDDHLFTPDYRRWGGGTHTAQNQRLLYWPMLKSGDFDMITPQLDFYKRIVRNAELRSETYWGHKGACFTEQLENFGLPQYFEWGSKRREGFDKGIQYNAWLEYTWDTVLEFCQIALDTYFYNGNDIDEYLPLIQSSLDFFYEHYTQEAKKKSVKGLDENGKLILYPGSAAETFKGAYNATSTVAALKTVTQSLLEYLKGRPGYAEMMKRDSVILKAVPDINFRYVDGHKVLSPAAVWSRVNNTEPTMLYPVFPWRMYGVGRPDLQVALDTWNYDPYVKKFANHISWTQYSIWAACLGLAQEAKEWTIKKLQNGPHRFPAFWGPGFDWAPDHNWGGSGMIGLQEMLLQEVGDTLLVLPAWPKEWDVNFKLHASQGTTVEVEYKQGKVQKMTVLPKSRAGKVKVMN